MAFILLHKPSGQFSDQTHIDSCGVIYTCGESFLCRADAEDCRKNLVSIGCNPNEWIVLPKPKNVKTSWIV